MNLLAAGLKKAIFTKNYVLFSKSLLNNYTISDKNVFSAVFFIKNWHDWIIIISNIDY